MEHNTALESVANCRQFGGLIGAEGRKIIADRLFRCSALNTISHQDIHYLAQYSGITILDYRDQYEASLHPDQRIPGASYVSTPANPADIDVDAKVVEFSPEGLAALEVDTFMVTLYQKLPFNNPAWQQLIRTLCSDDCTILIQHCAVGKDRTGIGSAIALLLLGCDEATIFEDYLATSGQLDAIVEETLQRWPADANQMARDNFRRLLAVDESWLAAAFTAIRQRYGSTQRWLEQEYGVTESQRLAIQAKWLEN
ncbi:tyrosine-protein phosphatase [Rosenbergiella australiborealis]|uniref:tyrosine-protein phosphatase n=1 Tax=Rosenbergiella australiborealis TaxID=1544696 RepID=UPI001F4E267C|nr:tyrosine-protein phosphatase [Rosenbergiella australiborealis]